MNDYSAGLRRMLTNGLIILAVNFASPVWVETAMGNDRKMAKEPAYEASFFKSPRQAVEAIRKMLDDKSWASLANYYELSGSDIDRKSLISGEFFIRTERPEAAHPGGFWRYKHPFATSFKYANNSPADHTGVVNVRVSIRIDQGAGSPAQEGWQEFKMRQSEQGFQILP